MDHTLAEQVAAADRYLLDEITSEERLAFEAHYFECTICAQKVRAGAIFADNAREVLCRQQIEPKMAAQKSQRHRPWLSWFKLPTLVPAFATMALALVVGYQNLVMIPALERPQVLSSVVIAPAARDEAPVITVDRNLSRFNLNFSVDSPKLFSSYQCRIQNDAGTEILSVDSGPRDVSSFTLSLLLPSSRFRDGRYQLMLYPQTEPSIVAQRYTFVIRTGK